MRDLQLDGPMKDWPQVLEIPGVTAALKVLHSKYTLCIATSAEHSDTQDMAEALARIGVEEYFHFFFSSFDLGCRKPDTEFFSQVLCKTGFSAQYTVSIGDKYQNDILPAKALGLKTIYFNESGTPGDFSSADAVISHMENLVKIIDRIVML